MTSHNNGLLVIVIGAQRKRADVHPLAARFGVSRKILIPLEGRPLISHVLETLVTHAEVARIAVSVEDSVLSAVEAAMAPFFTSAKIGYVPAANNIADSVIEAARGHDGPLIITTADNVLLTHESIDIMANALRRADVAVAMATREEVLAAHPDGQRSFYRFRDREYSNCNLYGMARKEAMHTAEVFRSGGQFAKKVGRIIEAFGLFNLILFRMRIVTLAGAFRRLSRRYGMRMIPVILADGSQAIDVDNERTYRVVSELLTNAHTNEEQIPCDAAA